MRAQLVVALVVVLILIAVPLYMWRRPSAGAESPVAGPSAARSAASATLTPKQADAAAHDERLRLAPIQRVKCSASRATRGQEGPLCDALPFFEKGLQKAIRENIDCAPRTGKPGSVNYVIDVDFTARRVSVFPGASGEWKGPQARRAAECVERSLPPADWDSIRHQYRFYRMAVLASYKPPMAPATPIFE